MHIIEVDGPTKEKNPHQVPLLSASNRNVRLQWNSFTETEQWKEHHLV